MIAPAPSAVGNTGGLRTSLEVRDRADAATLTGEGIGLALEFEHEAFQQGVDPEIGPGELAARIDASLVELPEDEHRDAPAGDFARWGRRGDLRTLALYGAPWFSLLALRRWEKVGPKVQGEHKAAMGGRA